MRPCHVSFVEGRNSAHISRVVCIELCQTTAETYLSVDMCKVYILSSSFLCETCGYEVCVLCCAREGAVICTSQTQQVGSLLSRRKGY